MRIDHYRESVWGSDLTSTEKLVLIAMTKWMDHRTLGDCRPGWAAIRRRTSLSHKTIERTIASCIRKGWLAREHRGGARKGGRREASVYRGTIPDHRHSDGSGNGTTTVTVSKDHRHSDAPPSQGPADVAATAGAASPPAQRTPRANGQTPHGCPYCHDLPINPPCTECQPTQKAATA